jgi:CRISPR/Cas system-associated endonuclease Cas3-HD
MTYKVLQCLIDFARLKEVTDKEIKAQVSIFVHHTRVIREVSAEGFKTQK